MCPLGNLSDLFDAALPKLLEKIADAHLVDQHQTASTVRSDFSNFSKTHPVLKKSLTLDIFYFIIYNILLQNFLYFILKKGLFSNPLAMRRIEGCSLYSFDLKLKSTGFLGVDHSPVVLIRSPVPSISMAPWFHQSFFMEGSSSA